MNSPSLISSPAALLAHESPYISAPQSQALLRLVEAAPEVLRLSQFFSWLQSHVQVLLPHAVLACGHYERDRRCLHFDVLPCLPLERRLIEEFSDAGSPLMRACTSAWVHGQGRALVLDLPALRAGAASLALGREAGLSQVSCHGVARPGRLHELESFFLFAHTQPMPADPIRYALELLLPQLHAVFGRVRALSRSQAGDASAEPPRSLGLLTARELQILAGVREGQSNQEIGERLNISALTVKNHVQKILRKLGAANRAQAVSLALAQNLFAALGPAP